MRRWAPELGELGDRAFPVKAFSKNARIMKLRTSNSIERLNEEIRRRERVIRIFPNEASIERLVGSLLIEQHERWISGKTYFTMDAYWLERDQAKTSADQIRQQQTKIA